MQARMHKISSQWFDFGHQAWFLGAGISPLTKACPALPSVKEHAFAKACRGACHGGLGGYISIPLFQWLHTMRRTFRSFYKAAWNASDIVVKPSGKPVALPKVCVSTPRV